MPLTSYKITAVPVFVAALLALQPRTCRAENPANPFEGDARFTAKYSFRFANRPVRDVLADVNQQTGIRLFSEQGVGDNRLSLTVHDRPLADTLQAVAHFYRWTWRRDAPKPGVKQQAGYTLLQTSESRKSDEEYVQSRLNRLATLLKKEAEAYSLLAPIDQKQREVLEEQLPSAIAQEKDPDKIETLKVRTVVLQDLHDRRLWKPTVYGLLATLSPAELSDLVRSNATCFAWPTIPGCRPIPSERIQELRRVFSSEFVPNGVPRGQIVTLRLRFNLVAGRLPYLHTTLQIGQRSNYGFSTFGMATPVPSAYTLLSETSTMPAPIEPPDWKADPALMKTVSVHLPVRHAPKSEPAEQPAGAVRPGTIENQNPPPYIWLTDALEKIDESVPLDAISDGLWTTRLPGIDVQNTPVGDVLNKLGRGCGHRWWKQDGFVMIQSRTLAADRWAEPPATAVARWAEQIDRGEFGLDEFSQIAALPDAQALTIQEMSASEQFPMFLSPLSSARSQLLLWNSFSPAQRRKALGSGLTYAELSPPQQQLFVLAATDPNASPQSAAVPDAAYLQQARLRIETQERACWGVHRMGPFATWRIPRGPDPDSSIDKRDEAVKRFLASDSSIRPDDIQAMTLVVHSFVYETDKEPLSRAMLQLPPRWEAN